MSIDENVKARKAAQEVMTLAMDEAQRFTGSAAVLFWHQLFHDVASVVPEELQPKRVVLAPVEPMADEESRMFGRVLMEFGKYANERVDAVPLEYFLWLDEQPDFRAELRRYLASRRIQAEQVDV